MNHPWFADRLGTLRGLLRFELGSGVDIGLFGFGSYYSFFVPASGTNPLDQTYDSRLVGFLMLLAWFTQGLGAWLKRIPLQIRLDQMPIAVPTASSKESRDEDEGSGPMLHPALADQEPKIMFYMLMHPIISGLLFCMAVKNLAPELVAMWDRWGNEEFYWGLVPGGLLIFFASIGPSIFVVRAMGASVSENAQRDFPFRSSRLAEFIADQLILFSFLILFATIFGLPAMMTGVKPLNPEGILGWAATLGLFVPLLWIGIMFFFVPFRLLIMLDGFGTWKSRLSSLLAISPLIAKYIIG